MTERPVRRERLRFETFSEENFPDGRVVVRVGLEWTGGRHFEAEMEGTQTLQGRLRASAQATVSAVQKAVAPALTLEFSGTKAVRVFDSWVVIVSIKATEEDGSVQRLLGALPAPDHDTARGAALAVLDATNRILERKLPR